MQLLPALKTEASPGYVRWLLIAMLLGTLLSLGRAVSKAFGAQGGIDFHAYWYAGHFVRAGTNPYAAFVARQAAQVPLGYLDRATLENLPVAQPGLAIAPTNTAPLVLLLAGFAWFSWPTAKLLWFLINLMIVCFTPWLVLRLLPEATLNRTQALLISFAFYLFSGTRVAIWTGQTSLVVFLCMLGALWLAHKHWLVAGLLLGIALSKYSLALPVFLLIFYRRAYRVAALGIMVQILGLLVVAYLGQESPLRVLHEYFLIFREHASFQGENCEACIHLTNLLPHSNQLIDLGLAIGLSALTFGLLWRELAKFQRVNHSAAQLRFLEFHILAILTLASLLIAYHRVYDIVIVISFVALLGWGLAAPQNWNLSTPTRTGVIVALGVFMFVMILPGEIGNLVLPQPFVAIWLQIFNASMTLSLLLALGGSLFLLGKIS